MSFDKRGWPLIVSFRHDYSLQTGEIAPGIKTSFVVREGGPLYAGLELIHCQDKTVLPRVIEELTIYRGRRRLTPKRVSLLDRAIAGLEAIVNPKEE